MLVPAFVLAVVVAVAVIIIVIAVLVPALVFASGRRLALAEAAAMTMMMTATATTTASTKAGTSITTVASTTIGIMMAAHSPRLLLSARPLPVHSARLCRPRLRSAHAHIILYDQSNWVVAPYDVPRCRDWNGIATASMCMTTTAILAGTCVQFAPRRSIHVEFSACSRALTSRASSIPVNAPRFGLGTYLLGCLGLVFFDRLIERLGDVFSYLLF